MKQKIVEEVRPKQSKVSGRQGGNSDSKSIKNFRMRKESDASRHSFHSHGKASSKSYDNSKNGVKDNLVYVPALNEKSFNNSTNKSKEN